MSSEFYAQLSTIETLGQAYNKGRIDGMREERERKDARFQGVLDEIREEIKSSPKQCLDKAWFEWKYPGWKSR